MSTSSLVTPLDHQESRHACEAAALGVSAETSVLDTPVLGAETGLMPSRVSVRARAWIVAVLAGLLATACGENTGGSGGDAAGSSDGPAPCPGGCSGATPVCDSSTNTCVTCTTTEGCETGGVCD